MLATTTTTRSSRSSATIWPSTPRCGQAGHVVTNGPVLDQPDEALRGIAIFSAESVDRARELANTDPAVQAGRLEVQAMTWLCRPGTMIKDGIPVSVED